MRALVARPEPVEPTSRAIRAACFRSSVQTTGTLSSSVLEPGTAGGFSIFLWAALTLPLLIGGFVAVFLTGVSIGDIHRHAHDHHRQHRERHETPAQH